MRFRCLDPDKAYRGSMLWIPKKLIPDGTLDAALTYWFAETPEGASEPVARKVSAWREETHHVVVPREFPREQIPCEVVDLSGDTAPIDFHSDIRPRDDIQSAAMQALRASRSGILCLGCGRGKTVIGLDRIALGQGPGLVVVNNGGLLKQWKNEAQDHLRLSEDDIGEVQGDTVQWEQPLVIAMVQTLWRMVESDRIPEHVRRRFATVIFDEAHHMSAMKFNQVASVFTGDRFGLTATPERADGNERFYLYHLGPILYRNLEVDVPPMVYFAHTDIVPTRKERDSFYAGGQINIGKIRQWQASLARRNAAIATLVKSSAKDGHKVLVLSHLKDSHIPKLQRGLKGCGVITSGVKGSTRLTELQKDVVVATMGAAEEGLDRPELSVCVVTTTFSSDKEFQQSSGRLTRPTPGKTGAEYIVVVDNVPKCIKHAKKIERSAKSRGYAVEHYRLEIP